MSKLVVSAFATLLATSAIAEVPKVVVDIAPVHSLVSQVMAGLGEPELLLQPNASPHTYAMRPSQATALENADIVVFTSFGLTPWLKDPLSALADDAVKLEVMELENTSHLEMREGEDGHDHGHGHEDAKDEHEEDHDDAKTDGHGDEGEEHEDGHDDEHADALYDPHGWLNPDNAKAWLVHIAEALIAADPENEAVYAANATTSIEALDALIASIDTQIASVRESHYMTLHDAFQYFDTRFGPEFAGSIALGDSSAPSPARIEKARNELQEQDVQCIFTEPQQSPRLVKVVIEGTDANTGSLDPMGADLTPGPNLYSEVLQGLANSFTTCLKG